LPRFRLSWTTSHIPDIGLISKSSIWKNYKKLTNHIVVLSISHAPLCQSILIRDKEFSNE
jgi:hypothetical protein